MLESLYVAHRAEENTVVSDGEHADNRMKRKLLFYRATTGDSAHFGSILQVVNTLSRL